MHEQDSGPEASTQPGNPARRRIFQAAAAAGVVAGAGTLPGVAGAAPTAAKAPARSSLDAKLREELRAEMRLIQRRVGATALFVTHDQAEALAIADVVAVMDRGRIVQAGPPEEVFERPATAFVASFVGRSAQLPGTARGGAVQAGPALLRSTGTPAAPPPDGEVTVFVRPHRIRLLLPAEGADNVLDGVVTSVDYTGEVAHLLVRTPAGPLPVDVGTASGAWRGVAPGQAVRLGWRAADTLCFRRGEA